VRGSGCRKISFPTLGRKPAISCYEAKVQCRRCSVVLHSLICGYIDEEVVGIGKGLLLIGDHWPKILQQNSKGASSVCVFCMCMWLKFVPGWPGISVSSEVNSEVWGI
jgi:hypothetical protein